MPPRRKSSGAGGTDSKAPTISKRKKSTGQEEKKPEEPKEETKSGDTDHATQAEKKDESTNGVNGKTIASSDTTNSQKDGDQAGGDHTDEDKTIKEDKEDEEKKPADAESQEPPTKKQKTATASAKPKKEPQAGSRKSSRGGNPSKSQLLRYLISPASEQLCRPDEEQDFIGSNPKAKTYSSGGSSPLNPFEELICALVLSRPISHRLGLRTIRTILNAPYEFSSARKVADAGDGERHQALWDAKTQHKDKTANQIGLAADVVLEKYTAAAGGGGEAKSPAKGRKGSKGGGGEDSEGTTLGKLRADCENDINEILDVLQKDIKGFGKTTAAIFRRRVQWMWPEAYPFVDERTADGLKELGLPLRAETLVEVLEENWDAVKNSEEGKQLAGDDEEARKRRAFTVILERATSARLEGKGGEIMQGAAQV